MLDFSPQAQARKGFGLSEILVAVAIFSTASLYLLSTVTLSHHAIKHSSDRIYAQDLAERVLEKQRSLPYNSVGNLQGTSNASYSQNGTTINLDFTYQVDSNEVTVSGTSRKMKNVAVTVSWVNRYMPTEKSRTRSLILETSVGE